MNVGTTSLIMRVYRVSNFAARRWVGAWEWDLPAAWFSRDRPRDHWEASLKVHRRSIMFHAGLLGMAALSVAGCTADPPQPTGTTEQAVVNPPLPSNLNLFLNAKNTLT